MRALRLGAAIVAAAAGLHAGWAKADGVVVRQSDPYVYVAPAAVPIVYDWSGIYIGGHLGAGNSRIKWIYADPADPVPPLEDHDHSHTGFVGGAFAGLQKQWSWIVVGAEVGYLWMDQPESSTSAIVPAPDRSLSSNVHNLLLVTGKFGWAWDNIFAYFKGGYATGDVDFRTSVASTGALLTSSSSREHGWTAAAGLEYALWQHVILGVEYNYVKLNVDIRDQVLAGGGPAGTQVTDAGVDIQTVTARLSFKFGGHRPEVVPVK